MIPWRNVGVMGFVATCLFAGCTVTTSDNVDGGTAAGGASSVIQCDPAAEQPGSCGQCLQTPDSTDGGLGGLCNEYKVCAGVAGCTDIVNAMSNCMANKAQANSGEVPVTADGECRASTPGMMTTDTTAASQAAKVFWGQISVNSLLICSHECWAV